MKNEPTANNALTLVSQNEELAKMYRDNAEVGASNLQGTLPLLKVHQVGKSSTNTLANGGQPTDGSFFYKVTAEEFKEVKCHVLTISRGYRSEGLNEDKKPIFNQILGGVIIDGSEFKPFLMYFTGKKLQNLWDFGKEAGKYTHAKPVPVPMFALTVKLTTEHVKNSFGMSWLVNFAIEKDESGNPIVVTDPGLFQFLRDHVTSVEETINNLISAKALEEDVEVSDIPHIQPANPVVPIQEELPAPTDEDAPLTEDDIPF